jgi:hypothetical protein
VYALLKTPPKNPVGKKGRKKEYITCPAYVAPIASLKTLHEKIQWEKTHQRKKSTTVDAVSVLWDRPVIFGIMIVGCQLMQCLALCNLQGTLVHRWHLGMGLRVPKPPHPPPWVKMDLYPLPRIE